MVPVAALAQAWAEKLEGRTPVKAPVEDARTSEAPPAQTRAKRLMGLTLAARVPEGGSAQNLSVGVSSGASALPLLRDVSASYKARTRICFCHADSTRHRTPCTCIYSCHAGSARYHTLCTCAYFCHAGSARYHTPCICACFCRAGSARSMPHSVHLLYSFPPCGQHPVPHSLHKYRQDSSCGGFSGGRHRRDQ